MIIKGINPLTNFKKESHMTMSIETKGIILENGSHKYSSAVDFNKYY